MALIDAQKSICEMSIGEDLFKLLVPGPSFCFVVLDVGEAPRCRPNDVHVVHSRHDRDWLVASRSQFLSITKFHVPVDLSQSTVVNVDCAII